MYFETKLSIVKPLCVLTTVIRKMNISWKGFAIKLNSDFIAQYINTTFNLEDRSLRTSNLRIQQNIQRQSLLSLPLFSSNVLQDLFKSQRLKCLALRGR